MPYDTENKYEDIVLVTEAAADHLNPREEIAYRQHRRDIAEWMLSMGKDPSKAEGYGYSTAKSRMNKLDLFYRWVWEQEERYVQDMTVEHADDWMHWLARQDHKESTKCHYQKSVHTLFKWQRNARDRSVEWEPKIEYSDPSTTYQPREYLSQEDRRKMRQAAMSYGSIPHYNSMTPEERTKWKTHLSQRLQKPKNKVTKQDFLKANSFKYTSMICTALDAGLRPCEVERAEIQWFDQDNGVLRIPEEDSSKSRENWIVALKPETATILRKWKQEREQRGKYDDTGAMWLTMYSNRYDKDSFRDVFRKMAKEADLDLENRDLSPYSIRHSTATFVAQESDLATAAKQCRHKSKQTTQKYAHSSVDRQEDAVNQID
jgi:integrase